MNVQSPPLRPISVDFEFIPQDDGTQWVVCVVAKDLWSGEVYRVFGDELGPCPPYPQGPNTVLIAYNSAAEISSYMALAWELPHAIIDLYAEHMRITNGRSQSKMNVVTGARGSLLAALRCHGLPARQNESKRRVIERILAGPPFSADDRRTILDYCQEDVEDAEALLGKLLPQMEPGWWDCALIRGRYSVATAHFERNGYPVDVELHDQIIASWDDIRAEMIASIDQFGVYENSRFSHARFEDLLVREGLGEGWPLTPTGARKTDEKTWRAMADRFSIIAPLCDAQIALGQMKKIHPLAIGPDGRARLGKRELAYRRLNLTCSDEDTRSVGLGAYRSKTGRNQPMASEFIMLRNNWWRTMVTPPPGKALLYADWASQEIAIAAYLSGDPVMIQHYRSGDFYLSFGRSAGLIPETATKQSHGLFRNKVLKPVSLGTLYGQKEQSLAARIGRSVNEAADLLRAHRSQYEVYWDWNRDSIDQATLSGRIETPLGWQMEVSDIRQTMLVGDAWEQEGTRETTLQNWPMQATAGDILRVACIAMAEAGYRICFPLHDAVLVEVDETAVEAASADISYLMEEAARAVLGHPIPVDVEVVRYGRNLRSEKGDAMWDIVNRALERRGGGHL
ncbi:DNA polymerase [Tropicimonas sp. TH_r6]|uniref:DNA polymerase n=1 Tax=Tropicimonas sp. TH_r6 TaxID=3082085 RepID=UPI0029553895|nr:DNA polymerase [Tropicimonas sp. TH_r6]MDV7145482.1 DNA polymerase [Tropicimonas sp. TH_r6]